MKTDGRTCSVNTKVTESELFEIRKLAMSRGMDLSSLARHLLLRELETKDAPGERSDSEEDWESVRVIRTKLERLLHYVKLAKDFEIEHGAMTLDEHYDVCVEACKAAGKEA